MYNEQHPNQEVDSAINEAISEDLNLDLAVETITNLDASMLSPSPSNKAVKRRLVEECDDADFENPPPREVSSHSSRGKNMDLARKSIRSVRSLSPMSSASSASSDDSEDWLGIINEELQRRAQFRQRVDGKMNNIKKKIKKTDDLISRVKGEKKSLRDHRETLREQLRLLDVQELALDKRERSAHEIKRKYEAIAAKFNEINN